VMNVEAGGLRGERDEVEFAHPFFERAQDHLLEQIKRKVSLTTRGVNQNQLVPFNNEKVTEVLSEVSMLKNRQEDLNEKLHHMSNENSELWKEVKDLRQKFSGQQRIVNKLIQFLGAMVQGQSPNGIGVKRKLKPSISMIQLALEEECSNQKEPKVEFPEEPEPREPIIQEVTEDIVPTPVITSYQQFQNKQFINPNLNHVNNLQNLQNHVEPEKAKVITSHRIPAPGPPTVVSGLTSLTPMVPSAPVFLDTNSLNSSMVPTKRPVLQRQITKEDFDVDVSNIQAELDSFKDTLFGQINLDNAMVSSLFDAESENVPSFYNSEEGLNLQDNKSVFATVSEPAKVKFGQPPIPATVELDLNTPLVQDESTDPLKAMFKRK